MWRTVTICCVVGEAPLKWHKHLRFKAFAAVQTRYSFPSGMFRLFGWQQMPRNRLQERKVSWQKHHFLCTYNWHLQSLIDVLMWLFPVKLPGLSVVIKRFFFTFIRFYFSFSKRFIAKHWTFIMRNKTNKCMHKYVSLLFCEMANKSTITINL